MKIKVEEQVLELGQDIKVFDDVLERILSGKLVGVSLKEEVVITILLDRNSVNNVLLKKNGYSRKEWCGKQPVDNRGLLKEDFEKEYSFLKIV